MTRAFSTLCLVLSLACGGASATESSTTPTAAADNLPLSDFSLFTPVGVVVVSADGALRENGELVGTFTSDGGFLNVDGVEIGRLTPSGQIYFAGHLDGATIDAEGRRLAEPSGTIASFDPNGNLDVRGNTLEVSGYAPEKGRSILFAFAMYSALYAFAQRQAQEAQPAPANGLQQ